MATVGVETSQNDAKPAAELSAPKHKTDKSVYTLLNAIVKQAIIINVIYFIGYFNWSVTWVLTPMLLVETHKYFRESNQTKRIITKESAATNEKDVILTRIKDLPSWVMLQWVEFNVWFDDYRCFLPRFTFQILSVANGLIVWVWNEINVNDWHSFWRRNIK